MVERNQNRIGGSEMKHGTQRSIRGKPPVDSKLPKLPPGFYYPLAVYMSHDGGEYCVRDYAGQSGRFCVIGPYTVDIMGSFKTLAEACAFIEKRAMGGSWQYRISDGSGEQK